MSKLSAWIGLGLLLGVAPVMAANTPQASASPEIASVNGKSITEKDLEVALSGYNDAQRQQVLKEAAVRKEFVNKLVEQELLVQEAVKKKLDQSPEFVNAMAAFRNQYLANMVVQNAIGDKMGDAAAREYFKKYKHRFSNAQVHAMHILVSSEAEAKKLVTEAKKPDVDFQVLAEKNSKDPSVKNNRGDLGFFTRDQMVEEFTNAAFSAEKGQVVGPVKTAYGYHVIKVVDRAAGEAPKFEESEFRVRNAMKAELVKDYVRGVRSKANVTIK